MKAAYYGFVIAFMILWFLFPWLRRRRQYHVLSPTDDQFFAQEFVGLGISEEVLAASRKRISQLTGFRKELISPDLHLLSLVVGRDLVSRVWIVEDLASEIDIGIWGNPSEKDFLKKTVKEYCIQWANHRKSGTVEKSETVD